jgi:hypothetical protein
MCANKLVRANCFLFLFGLSIGGASIGRAEECESSAELPLVGAARSDIAWELARDLEGHTVVAMFESEPDHADVGVVDQRAWAMRNAKCYFYSSKRETLLEAMYRERLMAQGVRVIDLQPQPASKRGDDRPELRKEQLTVMLIGLSPQAVGE